MPTRRTRRISQVLHQELGALFARCKDLEGHFVTISAIETSPDLRQAYVYISLLQTDEKVVHHILSILHKNRREWQHAIGSRIQTKNTPHLHFQFDPSLERGDHIISILEEINPSTPDPFEEDSPS